MALLYGRIAFVLRYLQVNSFQYQKYTYAKTLKLAHSATDKLSKSSAFAVLSHSNLRIPPRVPLGPR